MLGREYITDWSMYAPKIVCISYIFFCIAIPSSTPKILCMLQK